MAEEAPTPTLTDEQAKDVELDLLAAAILNPDLTEVDLGEADFYDPVAGAVWEAIRSLHRTDQAVGPIAIVGLTQARGVRCDHSRIVDLLGRGSATVVDARSSAAAIKATAGRRRTRIALVKAGQQLAEGYPLDAIVATITAAAEENTTTPAAVEAVQTLGEFAAIELPDDDWLIPGLMARGDRLVLTGSEGFGKSMLMRQLALCAASGIHPFAATRTAPQVRVLVVDCENPLSTMVRTYGAIRRSLHELQGNPDERVFISRHPEGLDLGTEGDRLKLAAMCRRFAPDLLVIGPAYKLYVGGANAREEDLARIVVNALDGLREQFGLALILEHHSPHATGGQKRDPRPIGSSLWLRWPEFGFGLVPHEDASDGHRIAEVKHWRGMREERDWPAVLEQGSRLPWLPRNPYRYEQHVTEYGYPIGGAA